MTDDDLIEAFIRDRGVTVCPPRTFSIDEASSSSGSWMAQRDARMRFLRRAGVDMRGRQDKVCSLVLAGKSRPEISEALRISLNLVDTDISTLKKQGKLPPNALYRGRPGPRVIKPEMASFAKRTAVAERRDRVAARIIAGDKVKDIARDEGISERSIREDIERLQRAGRLGPMPKRGHEEAILELTDGKRSAQEVADLLGIHREVVQSTYRRIRARGEPVNSRPADRKKCR